MYLRIFLAAGIPSGLLFALGYPLPEAMLRGILAGLFFGGILTLALGWIYKRSILEKN